MSSGGKKVAADNVVSFGRPSSPLRRLSASATCFMVGIVYSIPLFWVASLSIRDQSETAFPTLLPHSFTLSNFPTAFDKYGLGTLFVNTALITVGAVVISVGIAVPAAYAFARWRTRVSQVMFVLILIGLMIPPAGIIVPFFLLVQNLGLYDTLLAVTLGNAAFALPLALLLLRGFIDRIPIELTDAARIDGASPWKAFYHVVLPLLKAPIATTALFITLFSWNEFLLPLVFLSNPEESTLTVGFAQSIGPFGQTQLGLLSAATVMALLPLLIVLLATRRYYAQGLTMGALKQ
jgi:ABC-type glycerol-3-phosphate transport system permease component